MYVTGKRWWWLRSVMSAVRKLRDPGNPASCPDNRLPTLGYRKMVKAKKKKITLLFTEILPPDGTLWLT